jgi:hypothetical protein
MTDTTVILIALLAFLIVYMAVPPLVALVRRHPERGLIYKLTPLCLLSLILWLVLVAWALTGQRNDAVISRYVAKLRGSNRLPMVVALLVLLGLAGSLLPLIR